MKTFLQEVAHDLYQKTGGDFSRVAVVFPNKRYAGFVIQRNRAADL